MKEYEPNKPLISLHIPKCAGQSLRRILRNWFTHNFYIHYFKQYDDLPPQHDLKPGICIHGHFNNIRGFGLQAYYPQVNQFITFLRDPLEIAISYYFFWKKKTRYRQLRLGMIKEGDEHDYKSIEDFFRKNPISHIHTFLPPHLTMQNFRDEFEKKFVYIGIIEDMDTSLKKLSERLGFKPPEQVWINKSERVEELSVSTREKFIKDNTFAFEIYKYALQNYK